MNSIGIIQEARDLISDGLADAAAEILEEFVEEQPDHQEALKLIRRAYSILNDQERAAAFLRKSHDVGKCNESSARKRPFDSKDATYFRDNMSGEQEYSPGLEYETYDSATITDIEAEFAMPEETELGNDLEFEAFQEHETEWLIDDILTSPEEAKAWESVVLDDQFIDVEDEKIDYEEVEYTSRLTPLERSRQIVGEMALEYPIEEDLFDVLIECLAFHKCHGQTRKALCNLMDQYPDASELALVFELRDYWTGREAFSRVYYGEFASVGYINLSWSLGLAIVRCLGVDDPEEAIPFIEDCFEDWSSSPSLILGFNSFRGYMLHLVDHMVSVSPDGLPAYIDYQYFPDEEALARDFPGSAVYRWLEENNLVYREPVPYYSDITRKGDRPDMTEDEVDLQDEPESESAREAKMDAIHAGFLPELKTQISHKENPIERSRRLLHA